MKAMILAAGLGTRMAPLTDSLPKPLLRAGGKALIEWQIDALLRAGIGDLVINHFHLGMKIEEALQDGGAYGARIRYSRETERLETAGGIIRALPLLQDEWFVVVNADIWTDFDYARLEAPQNPAIMAHLVLVANAPHHPQGDFYLCEDGRLAWRDEAAALAGGRYTFSGISLLSRRLFEGLAPEPMPLSPLLRQAMDAGAVTGELHSGQWWDIGTPQRLETLDQQLRKCVQQDQRSR